MAHRWNLNFGGLPTVDRLPPTFAALRYPNYRRWFVGQALSLMGTWMQSVAQGWLVYELTGSRLALGTISFMGSIPSFFLMLPAGAIVDRVPRRRLLLITQSALMLLAAILALLAWTEVLQVWQVAVLALLLGIVNSFDTPARVSLAVEMVDDRSDMQNAIALNSAMFNLARIVGPAIGGLVLAGLGAAWCFTLNALSFLAVILALLGMHLPAAPKVSHAQRLVTQIGDGLRYVWTERDVRYLVILVGVTSLFGLSYSTLLPAFAADVLNAGARGLGALNAALGIGALAGSLTVASLSRSRFKIWQLTLGSILFPVGLIAFSASRTLAISLGILGVVGFSWVSQNATANTIVQSMVPDEMRGRVMSVYTFVLFGSMPFGALLYGWAAEATSPSTAVALGASITLACALYVFTRLPAIRHRSASSYPS